MNTRSSSIFNGANFAKHLSVLHDKYVVVPADKTLTILFFVRKLYYVDCLIKEFGIDNSLGNSTYTPTTLTEADILANHGSGLCSFGISTKEEEVDIQSPY